MKTKNFSLAAKLIIVLIAGTAVRCSDTCTVTRTYYQTVPQYMSFETLRASVAAEAPRDLVKAGKIYFKDGFLYINEQGEGIHVIDNRNPASPIRKGFIKIPGNFDLAIANTTLYADSYVDLVAIDVSTPGQEREVSRANNVFNTYSSMHFNADPVKGVIVGLNVEQIVREQPECDIQVNQYGWALDGNMLYATAEASAFKTQNVNPGGGTVGIGGSMARFAAQPGFLYALDGARLVTIDIASPTITVKKETNVSWDIETIFPYNNNLFLGSRTGMYIMGLNDPADPRQRSFIRHMRSCDPVVVEGNTAYVTLRNGNTCSGTVNELQVIDISDLENPTRTFTYPMTNPYGLGIDNGVLFICDGNDGLKVYDAKDKAKIATNMKAHYKDMQAFDIIPFNHVAMMIGEDGLFQYDYSNLQDIKLLSKIEIKKEEE